MRRALLRGAVAVSAAGGLALTAGCGGDGLPRALTPGQRADLHTLVGQARTAAGAGDLATTDAALERLKARVRTLRESGALDKAQAAELLKYAALAELKAQTTLRAAAQTPPAAVTPPPAPAPAAEPPPAVTPPPPAATARPGKAKQPKGKRRGKAKKGD